MTLAEILLITLSILSPVLSGFFAIRVRSRELELTRQKQDFDKQISLQKISLEKQQSDIAATKLAVDTVTAANTDLRAELDREKQTTKQLREDREKLIGALDEALDLNRTLKTEREYDSQRLDGLTKLVTQLQAQLTDLQDKHDGRGLLVAKLEGALEEQRRNHDSELGRINANTETRVRELENPLRNAELEIKQLKRDLEDRDRQLQALQTKASTPEIITNANQETPTK